jgi:hypothetical protein
MTKKEYMFKCGSLNNKINLKDEWSYIEPHYRALDNLIIELHKLGIIKSSYNICDAGFGLGTTMYGFYLESKNLNGTNFNFYGVEKYKEYIDFFNENLKINWNDNIKIYHEDIMVHNYSNYNLVYTYTPFKNENDLIKLYQKIINEISKDSILMEFIYDGKGFFDSILKVHNNNLDNTKLIELNGRIFLKKII